ncbi:MAG: flavin reductase family protein [Lentisphaerota bacterium]
MQKKTSLKSAMARKYPEAVVLVTTGDAKGRTNVMAVGWYAAVSLDPPMLMLVIDDEAFTYAMIRKTRQFIVAFPSVTMAKQVLFAGSHHGHRRDKIKECGLRTQPAAKVRAPLLTDAAANFECELVKVYRPGDCPLLVGKIIAAHENTKRAVKRVYVVGPDYKMRGIKPA